ncbi:MAG: membrane protein insertion efficiency factor YidD [Myxococcota bacterium]
MARAVALMVVSVLLGTGCAHAGLHTPPAAALSPWEPWPQPAAVERSNPTKTKHTHDDDDGHHQRSASMGEALVGVYQRYLRRPEGVQRCPMFPSCSRYTRRAIARYGLVPGSMLGFDRLFIRENRNAGYHYMLHIHDESFYLYDPVP